MRSLWLLILLSASAVAGNITIEADVSEFNEQTGQHSLTGNVIVRQDDMTLKADDVQLTTDGDRVTLMIATGNPATLTRGTELNGRAKVVHFDAIKQTVIFEVDAQVDQSGSRTMTGNRIETDLKTDFIRATGTAEQRVTLTFPVSE